MSSNKLCMVSISPILRISTVSRFVILADRHNLLTNALHIHVFVFSLIRAHGNFVSKAKWSIFLFVSGAISCYFSFDLVVLLTVKYANSNGLAPDNLFFHGVACNCIQSQLSHLGLETEFLPCQIQVDEKVWDGVGRKYWHGRDTYYLPVATWKK